MKIKYVIGYLGKSEDGKAQWPMWLQVPGSSLFTHHAERAHRFDDEKLAGVYLDDMVRQFRRNPISLLLFIAPIEV